MSAKKEDSTIRRRIQKNLLLLLILFFWNGLDDLMIGRHKNQNRHKYIYMKKTAPSAPQVHNKMKPFKEQLAGAGVKKRRLKTKFQLLQLLPTKEEADRVGHYV